MHGLEVIEPLFTYARVSMRLRQLFRNDHLVLSVLAIVVGAFVGISVIGFREAIDFFQGIFYGEQPPLDQLLSENLEYRVDFREMYAAVARDWWGLNAEFLPNKALSVIV